MSDVTEERFPEDVPAEDGLLFEDELGDWSSPTIREPRCPVLIIGRLQRFHGGPSDRCDEPRGR